MRPPDLAIRRLMKQVGKIVRPSKSRGEFAICQFSRHHYWILINMRCIQSCYKFKMLTNLRVFVMIAVDYVRE